MARPSFVSHHASPRVQNRPSVRCRWRLSSMCRSPARPNVRSAPGSTVVTSPQKSTCRRGSALTAPSRPTTVNERDPKYTVAPGSSSCRLPGSTGATWPPGCDTTNVPFVDPQSATRTSQPWYRISRWLRETLSPCTLTRRRSCRAVVSSRSGLRPMSSSSASSISWPSSRRSRPRLGRGRWTTPAPAGSSSPQRSQAAAVGGFGWPWLQHRAATSEPRSSGPAPAGSRSPAGSGGSVTSGSSGSGGGTTGGPSGGCSAAGARGTADVGWSTSAGSPVAGGDARPCRPQLQAEAAGRHHTGGEVAGRVDDRLVREHLDDGVAARPQRVLDPRARAGPGEHRHARLIGDDGQLAERHHLHVVTPRQRRRRRRRRSRRRQWPTRRPAARRLAGC